MPGDVWKQLIFSGTFNISATIAKLCSLSSRLSSIMVKNVGISNDVLSAGIVTLIVLPLKSGFGGSERERGGGSVCVCWNMFSSLYFRNAIAQLG